MKKIIECTFGDMKMIWPCDHGHFTMDDAMEKFLHMHMVSKISISISISIEIIFVKK